MLKKITLRHNLIGIILVLYLLPLVLITGYGTSQASPDIFWEILSIGLLAASLGSLAFYTLLYSWEKTLPKMTPDDPSLTPIEEPLPIEITELTEPATDLSELLQEEIVQLKNEQQNLHTKLQEALETISSHLEEINYRNEVIQQLTQERNKFQHEAENLLQDFQAYKHISEQTLETEKTHSVEYQETISEQRSIIEQKQQQIEQLDHKIRDLTYEIKTLLQLADMEHHTTSMPTHEKTDSSRGFSVHKNAKNFLVDLNQEVSEEPEISNPKICSSEDAKIQLKRCIDIAQKITGSHHFGAQKSRFGDLYLDNYALDLRRLCDNLRSENSGTILVYSPKDNKLLFTNNQIKDLLGWSPEKFVQDFDNIIQGGMYEWKSSISHMNTMSQTQSRLVMKAKTGQDKLIHCQLGLIPTGVFRNNIVGILYPA